MLADAIDYWDEYLVEGESSREDFIIPIAASLPSPRVGNGSSAQYHAALKKFLLLSDDFSQRLQDMYKAGVLDNDPAQNETGLLAGGLKKTELSVHQKKALLSKSVIAGVLSGGAKLVAIAAFPKISTSSDGDIEDDKFFPIELIVELIDELRSYRDKALYSLIAASGCRIHEALRVLIEDILVSEREVHLVNPKTRANHSAYNSFTSEQLREIAKWKGRESKHTFMLEPFKSLFFEYFLKYWKEEKPHDVDHNFAFCCIDNKEWGKPFLFATPSSIRHGFNEARDSVLGRKATGVGPHSFRHTYGYYLANFCPRQDGGFGLPLGLVQKLMGHKEISSTKIYAVTDKELAKLHIAYANSELYDLGNFKSFNELRRDILTEELRRIESEISKEGVSNTAIKALEAMDD